jgi:putative ABC transport system permease protein
MYLLIMAFKNLWRNKRRTILNLTAFTFNIVVLLFFVGAFRFRIEDGTIKTTKYLTGHIQIHQQSYDKEARKLPLNLIIKEPEEIISRTEKIPGVIMAGRRIKFSASVSDGNNKLGCMGIGFEPEQEAKFGLLSQSIVAGHYLKKSDSGVIIGSSMAKIFNFKVGDNVKIIVRTKYNTPNLIDAQIMGIFSTGLSELDKTTVFFPLPLAQELLLMEDEPTEIIIGLKDIKQIPSVIQKIGAVIPKSVAKDLKVYDWNYYSQALLDDVQGDIGFMVIFFVILLSIAIFSISNTMSMNIFERIREIGSMRAIGMSRKQIARLLTLESIIVSVLGALVGCIIGGIICFLVWKVGIPIETGDSGALPLRFYVYSNPVEFLGSFVLSIFAGILGGFLPALKARKLKIVDALREI